MQVPKWARESTNAADSVIGPSVQAQPSNLPGSSTEGTKSSSGVSGQTNIVKSTSPAKSSQTSSQSGTVSSSSGSFSSSSSHPSSGTSSGSGYPPSSSYSSGSSNEPPPSDNQKSSPESGEGGGGDSQPPSTGHESFGSIGEKKQDESKQHPSEENMDTTSSQSQTEGSLPQTSSQMEGIQTEGTQDSFLGRKPESCSLSSREGGESGYSGGSSSASVLASASLSKGTSGSLSIPLATVSDSQETVENSVSCIEDSVPLTSDAVAPGFKPLHVLRTSESVTPIAGENVIVPPTISHLEGCQKGETESTKQHKVLGSSDSDNKFDISCTGDSQVRVEGHEGISEQQTNKDVSSELLPVDSPQSPELLNNESLEKADDENMLDAPNSPEIAIQAPMPSHSTPVSKAVNNENQDHIVSQTLANVEKNSGKSHLVEDVFSLQQSSQAMETDVMLTQSSFVLQLADSQCSLAPTSPCKTDSVQVSEASERGESSKVDDVVANPEEIEEYEKEFPSLVRLEQQNEEGVKQDVPTLEGQKPSVVTADVREGDDPGTCCLNMPTDSNSKPVSNPCIPTVISNSETSSDRSKLPIEALVRSKPVPFYESLVCEDSVSETLLTPVSRDQVAGESQQSIGTSQGTGSGT